MAKENEVKVLAASHKVSIPFHPVVYLFPWCCRYFLVIHAPNLEQRTR